MGRRDPVASLLLWADSPRPAGAWLSAPMANGLPPEADASWSSGPGNPVERFIDPTPFAAGIKTLERCRSDRSRQPLGTSGRGASLAFAPNGKTLASGSVDGELMLWDLPKGTSRKHLGSFQVPLLAVGFCRTGCKLAVGGGNPRRRQTFLKLLDSTTGKQILELNTPRGPVFALAFSPSGNKLASAGLDQIIRLWDLASGAESASFRGHTAVIWSLSFDQTGERLASASWDKTRKGLANHSASAC